MIIGGYDVSRIAGKDQIKTLARTDGLVNKLTEVARSGFGSDMTFDDVRDHVLGGDMLYLVKESGNPVGFASFLDYNLHLIKPKRDLDCMDKDINARVLFLDGIVVQREHQGKGLFRHIMSQEIAQEPYEVLAMRTQSPVMYAATKHLPAVEVLHPNGRGASCGIYLIATEISKRRYGVGIPTDFVMRNIRSGVYEKVPSHKEVDAFFRDGLHVDAKAGDFVFLLAQLKKISKLEKTYENAGGCW